MITNVILWFLYSFVGVITSPLLLLPDVVLNSGMSGAIHTSGGFLSPFDIVVPVGVLLSVLAVFLTFELTYGTYKVTMWIIRRFPTQS